MAQFDFNLRGILRLRLNNATQREANIMQRQLGSIGAEVEGEPDITIDFTDRLPEPADLRYIGLNDAAYYQTDQDSAFYILKGKHKSRVKVTMPFDQIGQAMTIHCERDLSSVPLLVQVINLALLTKGILAVHASAFSYRGLGALITGWAKGGKTETLLAFTSQGANYVGDEWIYLSANDEAQPEAAPVPMLPGGMFGIPEPIRVWNWHLESLPHYRSQLKRKDQLRLNSLAAISRSMDWLAGSGNGKGSPTARVARRLRPVVNRQMFAHFPPHSIFGADHVQETAPLDQIFFTVSHNSEEIRVEPADAQDIARRMLYSITEEQSDLLSYYRKYRFAFPDRCNPWLDNLERIQHKMLMRALKDVPAYAVYHPYPVHIPRLYEALEPYFPQH